MKKIAKLLTPLFFVIGMFISVDHVHATALNPDDYITDVNVTDSNGNTVTDTTPVNNGSIIHVNVKWAASSVHMVQPGDTMTIPLVTNPGSNTQLALYSK